MIQNLSVFYRTSLANDPLADVTLAQEVALQKQYLAIEEVRFPDRLASIFKIEAMLRDLPVPAMILQPLVENAIKHGVARSKNRVTISITAKKIDGYAIIEVSNDGIRTSEKPNKTRNGIGLINVQERLLARYGNAASFSAIPLKSGGFVVRLTLPIGVEPR
jgi:two-component system, LytTR family, sensor kinase